MGSLRELLNSMLENDEVDFGTFVSILSSEDEQVGYQTVEDLLDSEDDYLDMGVTEYDRSDDGDLRVVVC